MVKKNIGLDLDGCLADFNKEFLRLSRKLLGKPKKDFVVTDFHYHNCGWTKAEADRVIKEMRHTDNFWRSGLDRLPNTNLLSKYYKNFNVFFITSRFSCDGPPVNYQSEDWLREQFGLKDPYVIVTDEKGKEAEFLSLDAFIDDRFENCQDIVKHAPDCKVSILTQTWNTKFNDPKITRVASVNDWLKGL